MKSNAQRKKELQDLLEDIDKKMDREQRRYERLLAISKKNPDKFLTHVEKVLSKITINDFKEYRDEILRISKRVGDNFFQKHSKLLSEDEKGFFLFLTLAMEDLDYTTIASQIGIDINRLITLNVHVRFPQENPETETAESILEKLPLVQGIRPKIHTMPNNKLMNELQESEIINNGEFDIESVNKKITSYTMINYEPDIDGANIIFKHLIEYERQVSDAVISLWKEAKKRNIPPLFTVDMIYGAMPGGGERASESQSKEIIDVMEKFRRLHVIVDATNEMRARKKIKEGETFKLDSFYIVATRAEYKAKHGGKTITAYKIESEPIILTYCEKTDQILSIPAKYISIEKVKNGKASGEILPMSASRQSMTGYILRRIQIMKNDIEKARERKRNYNKSRAKDETQEGKPLKAFQKQSTVILFNTLFADAGLTGQDKKTASRNREFVCLVLDYQVAVGNIKGYERQTKGRSITGVKILLT